MMRSELHQIFWVVVRLKQILIHSIRYYLIFLLTSDVCKHRNTWNKTKNVQSSNLSRKFVRYILLLYDTCIISFFSSLFVEVIFSYIKVLINCHTLYVSQFMFVACTYSLILLGHFYRMYTYSWNVHILTKLRVNSYIN